jgi:hypothetical protein
VFCPQSSVILLCLNVLFGWWFLRLISRLRLICCERKTLYHDW